MRVKKVKWVEFNAAAYQMVRESDPMADPKDYEKTYEGSVIETYKPIIGSPRFVVAMPDGEIREVKMTQCRVTEFEGAKR